MIPRRNLRRFFYKTMRQPGYAFGVLRRRLMAYAYYLFGGGKSSYPEAITLFLTHRCNLQCRMCGQWGREGVTKKQGEQYIKTELAADELMSLIDDVARFRPNITLFGGEPLLYGRCIEIIKRIKQRRMHCLIITNGFLLDDLAERIVDSGLDELNVSLDGGAELHDKIRGMSGLFDKIMKGLQKINYFKKKMLRKTPYINLQCTITPDNYLHLEQLIRSAEEADADSLTFHNLIFISRELLAGQKKYDAMLDSSSLDWNGFISEPGIKPDLLREKIEKILSGRYRFSIDFYPNFSRWELEEYYNNPCYAPAKMRCLSPWMAAYVLPDGEVRPCLNSSYSYGNVLNAKFTEIWNDKNAIKFRRFLKENRAFTVCARCTEVYRY